MVFTGPLSKGNNVCLNILCNDYFQAGVKRTEVWGNMKK